MVLDMARPKYKEHHMAWNAWKRCCKKVDSQGEHLTDSWSISQRSCLSWITTRNRMDRTKVQRFGRTCERRPYISSHSRRKDKIQRTMVSHFEQSRQKWANEAWIRFSTRCLDEKSSTPRIRRTSWRANAARSIQSKALLFKHIVVEQELELSS